MGKRLLVLHGPNLNLLGEREGTAGGRLADLDVALQTRATRLGLELKVVQSNHEGVLLDTLHRELQRLDERPGLDGVVVSPSSLFGSYPLRDALEAVGLPALEVYLEPLDEARRSVVAEACVATVAGDGFDAYLEALERFAHGDLEGRRADVEVDAEDEDAPEEAGEEGEEDGGVIQGPGRRGLAKPGKTLGRKAPSVTGKTLGRRAAETVAASNLLTRALVRRKVAEQLSGELTPAGLSTWARAHWMELLGGAPTESGYRDLLEESLQRLALSSQRAGKLTDAQLVDLMARLDE